MSSPHARVPPLFISLNYTYILPVNPVGRRGLRVIGLLVVRPPLRVVVVDDVLQVFPLLLAVGGHGAESADGHLETGSRALWGKTVILLDDILIFFRFSIIPFGAFNECRFITMIFVLWS